MLQYGCTLKCPAGVSVLSPGSVTHRSPNTYVVQYPREVAHAFDGAVAAPILHGPRSGRVSIRTAGGCQGVTQLCLLQLVHAILVQLCAIHNYPQMKNSRDDW